MSKPPGSGRSGSPKETQVQYVACLKTRLPLPLMCFVIRRPTTARHADWAAYECDSEVDLVADNLVGGVSPSLRPPDPPFAQQCWATGLHWWWSDLRG